ncbi:mercury methylation ferredoxin HgcB [Helicovermis profundi]|uniref:Mercury methylation ferredoxin HgcB n=1 Tax=Helicovermis profundi TaxID=3065157 RepID=A0AAU9E0G1_9FIRM|nr:mercury methylation ferredoxin HgcB [Clostridia bacterium S502]
MKYLDNVVSLKYDANKCIGCKKCYEVCPHRVFIIKNNKAVLDKIDSCIECGACMMNCPSNAIEVDQGVGCASAIISGFIKRNKFLSKFIKKDSCC